MTGEQDAPQPREGAPGEPHVPSLVTGLAALLVVVLVALSILTDVRVDVAAAAAAGLMVLGGLLLTGGAVAGLRDR